MHLKPAVEAIAKFREIAGQVSVTEGMIRAMQDTFYVSGNGVQQLKDLAVILRST